MLDIERFQTVFKSLARGSTNIMQSICNHYMILEAALTNRLVDKDVDWDHDAPGSTIGGFAARRDASDRRDRITQVLGLGRVGPG